MIQAMDFAVQGMQRATDQANKAAGRILEDTTTALTPPQAPITSNNTGSVRTATRDLVAPSTDNLINDIVDLKTAVINFKANAAVYKRMSDMTDEFIKNFP